VVCGTAIGIDEESQNASNPMTVQRFICDAPQEEILHPSVNGGHQLDDKRGGLNRSMQHDLM
jgi:hypothetical protein